MSWEKKAVGNGNIALVNSLIARGIVKHKEVEEAMKAVDRADFLIQPTYPGEAYEDRPQPIGFSATISAPHMHAYALVLASTHVSPIGNVASRTQTEEQGARRRLRLRNPVPQSVQLNNRCAYFRKLMGEGCKVYGIDHIEELVEISRKNIARNYKEYLADGSITLVAGDGRKGLSQYGPYDVIHVGAAAEEIPMPLVEQLAPNGILV